jgi:hypothetical protein
MGKNNPSNPAKNLTLHTRHPAQQATSAHWTWHTNPDAESKTEDELWIVKGQDC